jgi:hypothetical protein
MAAPDSFVRSGKDIENNIGYRHPFSLQLYFVRLAEPEFVFGAGLEDELLGTLN